MNTLARSTRTEREVELKNTLVGCFKCYPFCGAGGASDNGESGMDCKRNSSPLMDRDRWSYNNLLCPDCAGKGVPGVPMSEVHEKTHSERVENDIQRALHHCILGYLSLGSVKVPRGLHKS